ncbi:MAG: 4-hydroxy-3-methylbut-2-en-1-yl diphosphate synthase [Dehalococcoidia bacterium]|nr:4-hydroxy-3-methylbut-2-en-1-yl diphosphate synthase [Dehalococcoidia bacterium]MQG09673.1 flavodoxin-dependent (E)-4-hydroxy-3-methylbut-2-enyl-diphosphate synthase [SAR202 cluster bacterium]
MTNKRKKTNEVLVGNVKIGNLNPVVVQSMTDTDTANIQSTVDQIKLLTIAGSEIVRVTVNNDSSAKSIKEIISRLNDIGVDVPIVGDFHFIGHRLLSQYKDLAKSLSKFRINPGNVGRGNRRDENFSQFINIAKEYNKPVRIGVNAGSLDPEVLALKMDENSRLKNPLSAELVENQALVESALSSSEAAINMGLSENNIIISCKVSRLNQMVAVYRELSEKSPFPLHLGLTEAGMGQKGVVSTTAALSILLESGIGDTIRASLTPEIGGDRAKEVRLCQDILQSLGIRRFRPAVTACPGCGRTTSTFFRELAQEIQSHIDIRLPEWKSRYPNSNTLEVAVMGCVVNGPGESKAANIGISLPGSGEDPKAPVFIDGQRAKFLSGSSIAKDFIGLVDDYVDSKFGSN